MKLGVFAVLAALTVTTAAWAQTVDSDDPTVQTDPRLAKVAPAKGPVWWQVTKGDSVVWILGAPPTRSQGILFWDKTAYRRRLAKARLIIVPYGERVSFLAGETWPPLSPPRAAEVRAALTRLRSAPGKDEQINLAHALHLRDVYVRAHGLEASANVEIVDLAQKARIPLVRVPITQYTWRAASFPPGDAQIDACAQAVLEFVRTPPSQFNLANESWSVGDLPRLVATTPEGMAQLCRRYWAGHREETIAFQSFAVMEALRRPGSVVAIYPIEHLIAEDGILARLRAKGYAVTDPAPNSPEN